MASDDRARRDAGGSSSRATLLHLATVRRKLAEDGLAEASIDAIVDACVIRTFRRGEVVSPSNSPEAVMMISGYAAPRLTDADGREFLLMVARRGQVYQQARIDTQLVVDLVAVSTCLVAIGSSELSRRLAEHDPMLAFRTLDLSGRNYLQLLSRLAAVTFDTARERFAVALLAYEPLIASSPPVLRRTDLAALIGTSREMVSRVTRDLEERGVIGRAGRAVRILNRPALLDVARWEGEGQVHYEALRGSEGRDPRFDEPELLPTALDPTSRTIA